MSNEFDYIVVGGGSSGCVMASRLSEDSSKRVLLIESGHRDSHPYIHIPSTFFKVIEKGRDIVPYVGERDEGVNGRESVVLQGHVIGGGSSVNAMIYIRGHANDYNQWAQLGNKGWSYDDVLPAFRDVENNMVFSDGFHGTDGELRVSEAPNKHPLSRAFIRAGQEVGLPYNPDFNGAIQEGVGFYQSTTHNGRRWSSAQAFLRKAEKRKNLTIMTQTRVAKILFEGKRATGVQLEDGRKMTARGEIVLCAGAIETPRLMQLSGVGPAEHLREHGIEVVADLPGVGSNYQDHMESTVQGETYEPISLYREDKGLKAVRHMLRYLLTNTGLVASNVVECGGFADVSDAGQPDVQFHCIPFMAGWVDRAPIEAHGFQIAPCFLRPKSRGSVRLRSSNPTDKSLFDAATFRDSDDLEVLTRGVLKAIDIMNAPAMQKFIKRRALPEEGLEKDMDALRDYVRQTCKTVFHPSGTAKMGVESDKMSVVDNELRVRGLEGLRVADASVMPTLVSGNTNAPVIMIAERCSRFITGKETVVAA
ncbi:GMC family oxidoreductase [Celeribacter litoreus]|uniref:GMC family oxidoreductase n=1 Tax=Celeribacter litoreus TaxID=2876714 RepID=UPI001CCC1247|nr:GMC family oxidoreductase N-terminal domain-containing protein [Celeribacter litoreus]MCA0044836.1 GMC family oxidoreductase N-terminal domain-containing protein [Celeribacter litoreus]